VVRLMTSHIEVSRPVWIHQVLCVAGAIVNLLSFDILASCTLLSISATEFEGNVVHMWRLVMMKLMI
jgi:hypothetical protein